MAGNMGNMGNMGNLGNVARFGYSISTPDRVDLPFIAERLPSDLSNTRVDVRELRVELDKWPDRSWSGEWRAWLLLNEFVQKDWRSIQLADWRQLSSAERDSEFAQLASMAEDERADALGEIVSQHGLYINFLNEFTSILGVAPESHPNTIALLHVGGVVGIFICMHLKNTPREGVPPRPRPSQLLPALKPPIEMPLHPAYPSGHATQAALMAHCVRAALPTGPTSNLSNLLDVLAWRIARNREIAGLHFPSDSKAGRVAAQQTFEILKELESFKKLANLAKAEWHPST